MYFVTNVFIVAIIFLFSFTTKQSRLESDLVPTPNDISCLQEQCEPWEADDALDENNSDHNDEIEDRNDLFS